MAAATVVAPLPPVPVNPTDQPPSNSRGAGFVARAAASRTESAVTGFTR